jgi:Regulator of G protein signaling domain
MSTRLQKKTLFVRLSQKFWNLKVLPVTPYEGLSDKKLLRQRYQALVNIYSQHQPITAAAVHKLHPGLALDVVQAVIDEQQQADSSLDLRQLAIGLHFAAAPQTNYDFEADLELAYTLYDEDGDGGISMPEFRVLLRASTRGDKMELSYLLSSQAGQKALLHFLKSEHSCENLQFLIAVNGFCSGLPTVVKAQAVYDTYCSESAVKQVNISASLKGSIKSALQTAADYAGGSNLCSRHLFDDAAAEIFDLMSRDGFSR